MQCEPMRSRVPRFVGDQLIEESRRHFRAAATGPQIPSSETAAAVPVLEE